MSHSGAIAPALSNRGPELAPEPAAPHLRAMTSPPAEASTDRRLALSPGHPVGVDEPMIETLVHAFYAKVRQDPELGPIFEAAVDDWDEHLTRLCAFWSSVMLMTGRFKGSPMATHAQVEGLQPAHFGRWLELFQATARQVCPPAAADVFTAKANQIGESLKLGLAASRGELPPILRP